MAPKLSILLFLLCLSQSSARDHPLDHLGSSKSLAFHYVGLDEPDKPDVLAWQSGRRAALPRRAFVIARADRQTHELYIDISNSSITSDKIYDGFRYPAFISEEVGTVSALPFNHTPFVESVRKRGLELRDVVCLAFTMGWYGERGEAGDEKAGRLDVLRDGRDGKPLHEAFGGGEDVGGFGRDGDRRRVSTTSSSSLLHSDTKSSPCS